MKSGAALAWKKASRFDGPEDSPGFLLWKASTKWRRHVEAALLQVGLTPTQFVLLAGIGWLTQDNKKATQVELARHCELDIAMTSQILRMMERKGYVVRIREEGNDRAKYPRLTPEGVQLVELAMPLVESADAKFFQLHENEKKDRFELLHKLALV